MEHNGDTPFLHYTVMYIYIIIYSSRQWYPPVSQASHIFSRSASMLEKGEAHKEKYGWLARLVPSLLINFCKGFKGHYSLSLSLSLSAWG